MGSELADNSCAASAPASEEKIIKDDEEESVMCYAEPAAKTSS